MGLDRSTSAMRRTESSDEVRRERYPSRPLNLNKTETNTMKNTKWEIKNASTGYGCVATRIKDGAIQVAFPENGYDFASWERDDMFIEDMTHNA
tara:strand:- start:379 stop:660 length:282 start_codon:yes stop_codon:yes gene_type:complete